MILASRQPEQTSTDILQEIENSDAVIEIIDDTVTDPPSFSITLSLENGKRKVPLLLQTGGKPLTLFDLIDVIDRLGFSHTYSEIR